jgi:prepilin-type N-terminal cleavage/methylation domain-containing protein
MTRQGGFTLLELMIVVALIVIIAAVAIPSLTEAKINAHEASAVQSIRAIAQAEVQYQATYGGFADALSNLGGADPCTKSAETACSSASASSCTLYHSRPKISASMRSIK